MKLKGVLFDLDGTLLPMADQNTFIRYYFSELTKFLSTFGYDPKQLMRAIGCGVQSITNNDGAQSNETAFWNGFVSVLGEKAREDESRFAEFYETRFDGVRVCCGYNEKAAETVGAIRGKGLRVALATNPFFPAVATRKRMTWAGLSPEDFELYTTYENSRFCKPSLNYYREILDAMGLSPEETMMVGNDVDDDMIASALGMRVFLLTDCLINVKNADISAYPNGDFDALMAYIAEQVGESNHAE